MELKYLLAVLVWLGCVAPVFAQQTQSTVQPNVPALGTLVEQSGPALRQNFQAAISDLNVLFARTGSNAARTRLTAPLVLRSDTIAGTDQVGCGLNTGAAACRTLQYLYTNVLVATYDTSGQNVTLSFANNDTCLSIVTPWVGGGILAVQSAGGAFGLSCPTTAAINVSTTLPGALLLNNMILSGVFGVFINSPALVQIRGGITFGAVTSSHIFSAASGATTICTNTGGTSGGAGYTITGGGFAHIIVEAGTVNCSNLVFTLTGTPAFSVFAQADNSGSSLLAANGTYTGSATGSRYLATANASIITLGGGANYFPGNSPGNTLTGGQYQ